MSIALKTSIIIPTFNRASLLMETLYSIGSQTYTNWECIVVDDGSTDTTQTIVSALVEEDSRFTFIERPEHIQKGAPSCRNLGLKNATGTLVLFFDSDDVLAPDTLLNRIAVVQTYPGYDFWVFQTIRFSETIGDDSHIWNVLDTPNQTDLESFLGVNPVWHTSGPLFSRKFLTDNALEYTERVRSWQDWEFHIRILLLQPTYYKCDNPDAAAFQRFHAESAINKDNSVAISRDRLRITSMLITEFKNSGKLTREKQQLFFKLYYFILSRSKELANEDAVWNKIANELPLVGRWHHTFWKNYLKSKTDVGSAFHYKRKKFLEKLKEMYFYKRMSVDDFSHRQWYKNTLP